MVFNSVELLYMTKDQPACDELLQFNSHLTVPMIISTQLRKLCSAHALISFAYCTMYGPSRMVPFHNRAVDCANCLQPNSFYGLVVY